MLVMKTKTHTPGPWLADGELVRESNGKLVADCTIVFAKVNRQSENLANAALVAAAPELFAALQYVAANHHEGSGDLERIVLAAIAKVEGGAK